MTEIYINGEKASWKRISDEYGENYCKDLREFVKKECKKWDSVTSEDGTIDIFIH